MSFVKMCFLLCFVGTLAIKCPHPGLPKNGFAVIYNLGERYTAIRPLSVGEQINFYCFESWIMASTDSSSFKCVDGTSQFSIPHCLKVAENFTTTFYNGGWGEVKETFPECNSKQYDAIEMEMKSSTLLLENIAEIHVELCDGSNAFPRVYLNGFENCNFTLSGSLKPIFTCNCSTNQSLRTVNIQVPSKSIVKKVTVLLRFEDRCGAPPTPLNGKWKNLSNSYFYECDTGYSLVGRNKAKCNLTDGQWSSVPKCTERSIFFGIFTWLLIMVAVASAVPLIECTIAVTTMGSTSKEEMEEKTLVGDTLHVK